MGKEGGKEGGGGRREGVTKEARGRGRKGEGQRLRMDIGAKKGR